MVSEVKKKKLYAYKYRAKKKGIEFSLSDDDFYRVLHGQCYICGKDGGQHEIGIDRINNDHGYKTGNIAPCCWECNKVKGNLKGVKFFNWLRRICPKHPLITKGHSQPKGYYKGQFFYIDVYVNKEILKQISVDKIAIPLDQIKIPVNKIPSPAQRMLREVKLAVEV